MDPRVVGTAVSTLRVDTTVQHPEGRYTQFCSDFQEKLQAVGYAGFVSTNLTRTVCLLCGKIEPESLRREMRQRAEDDESLEKNAKRFMCELIEEAKQCNKNDQVVKRKTGGPSNDGGKHKLGKGETNFSGKHNADHIAEQTT